MLGGWMGVDLAAMQARNAEMAKAQRDKADADKITDGLKCDLCGRVGTQTWLMNGPFPYKLCVDVDACDAFRWNNSKPLEH